MLYAAAFALVEAPTFLYMNNYCCMLCIPVLCYNYTHDHTHKVAVTTLALMQSLPCSPAMYILYTLIMLSSQGPYSAYRLNQKDPNPLLAVRRKRHRLQQGVIVCVCVCVCVYILLTRIPILCLYRLSQ